MKGFIEVLGATIEISHHTSLIERHKDVFVLITDLERAILNADAARLTGAYAEYTSRFVIPVPFSSTVLTFIDVVLDELTKLRLKIASATQFEDTGRGVSLSPAAARALSTASVLRLCVLITSSDLLKLGLVFEHLGWLKTEPTDKHISQSALLLDELQQCYCKYETSAFFVRLITQCRQAFVDSLLKELSYGGYINQPVDSIISRNYLVEDYLSQQDRLASISDTSLPAFLININAPLVCYLNLLSLLLKHKSTGPGRTNLYDSQISDQTTQTESIASSTGGSLAEVTNRNSSFDASLLENPASDGDKSSAKKNSLYLETIYQAAESVELSDDADTLLWNVSRLIDDFRAVTLPTLFHGSVWPLADVECLRELIVSINKQLSETLNAGRHATYAWLNKLLLQGPSSISAEHAIECLLRYSIETIYITLPSISSYTVGQSGVAAIARKGQDLLVADWFKVHVPLKFVIRGRQILAAGKDIARTTQSTLLFEVLFQRKLKRIYKHVTRAVKNKDLIRGDYVLLSLSSAIPLLVFGVVHFHLEDKDLAMGRSGYFLEESSQRYVESMAYLSRLTAMAHIGLVYTIATFSQLEKSLGRLEYEGRGTGAYSILANGKFAEETQLLGLEEQNCRRDFLKTRGLNPSKTNLSPIFPSITRLLNLMNIFVTSYGSYLHCMAFGLFEPDIASAAKTVTGSVDDVAVLIRKAFTYGAINTHIRGLIESMLLLCIRQCYLASLLRKLTTSFKDHNKLFPYILRDCKELELRFLSAWETLVQDLIVTEQSQISDSSCATLLTWLPALSKLSSNVGAQRSDSKPVDSNEPEPAQATQATQVHELQPPNNPLFQFTKNQYAKPADNVGIYLPHGAKDLSSLRLGNALNLRINK